MRSMLDDMYLTELYPLLVQDQYNVFFRRKIQKGTEFVQLEGTVKVK